MSHTYRLTHAAAQDLDHLDDRTRDRFGSNQAIENLRAFDGYDHSGDAVVLAILSGMPNPAKWTRIGTHDVRTTAESAGTGRPLPDDGMWRNVLKPHQKTAPSGDGAGLLEVIPTGFEPVEKDGSPCRQEGKSGSGTRIGTHAPDAHAVFPPDLQKLIHRWPTLSPHVRAQLWAITNAANAGGSKP